MKTFLIAIVALVLLVGTTYAQGKKDAEALVKKAITLYKSVGKEKSFEEFNDPKGKFVNGDLYIAVDDIKGNCVAHGINPKMIGKNFLDVKDADGKLFSQERMSIVKSQGKGWQTYKWTNPTTKQLGIKDVYFEKVDDLIFICGFYR